MWKKTDEAKKKLEKLEKSKECKVKKEKMMEEKARLESLLSESKKKLEALSNLARGLQTDIKKLNTAVEVDMVEVDSDEENITTRKVMSRSPSNTPLRNRSLMSASSTSTKRKLEDMTSSSVKSGLGNIYQFGDSSDSVGQSGVRAGLHAIKYEAQCVIYLERAEKLKEYIKAGSNGIARRILRFDQS